MSTQMVVTPNEIYLGSGQDIEIIKEELGKLRELPVTTEFIKSHIAKLKGISSREVPLKEVRSLDAETLNLSFS